MTRTKHDVRVEAQCHVCGESVSIDVPVRSKGWAFGIAGVRWLLCSPLCREKLGTSGA